MQHSLPTRQRILPHSLTGLLLALLVALVPLRAFANTGIYASLVRLTTTNALGTTQNSYYLNDNNNDYSGVGYQAYQNQVLGTFISLAGDVLTFNGGELKVYADAGEAYNAEYLYYAIYPTGQRPGNIAFTQFQLNYGGFLGGNNTSFNRYNGTANLLSGLATGTYTLEFYAQSATSAGDVYLNNNSATNYTATFVVAAPLPVSLTTFKAVRQDQNVALTWATASETDNAGFEVQVSQDGKVFRKLGFVAAASPGSLTARTYSFVDREAGKTGTRYYRLRQLDLSGQDSFSAVRPVAFDAGPVLTAAPNPFGEHLVLSIWADAATTSAPLTLTDALGRIVLHQAVALEAGANQLSLPGLATLPAGVYVLRLPLDGQVRTAKLVKQ